MPGPRRKLPDAERYSVRAEKTTEISEGGARARRTKRAQDLATYRGNGARG